MHGIGGGIGALASIGPDYSLRREGDTSRTKGRYSTTSTSSFNVAVTYEIAISK